MRLKLLKEYKIIIVLLKLSKDNKVSKFISGPHLSLDKDYALKDDVLKHISGYEYEYIPKKNGGPKKGKRSYYFYIKGYNLIPQFTN